MHSGSPYLRIAVCLAAYSTICLGQQRSSPQGGSEHPIATKVIFDQNDPTFYGSSTQQLQQFPSAGNSIPFGKFAVFVGLEDENGKIVGALEPKPLSFDNLRTGYYTIPQPSGGPLNAFGLVINADDPRNRHGDISYVMPCVWLSWVTWPREKILRPWIGSDSLEYSVDMRVPFANSPNIYHPFLVEDDEDSGRSPDFAAPYVLAGLYFEQLKRVRGDKRPPAFWIAVTLFDLRKNFARESLIVDNWSGGTNYPIITSAVGSDVYPDNGMHVPYAPPRTPLPMGSPTYSFTPPGSQSMMSESGRDGRFRHFSFRITREHFLAAVDGIKSRYSAYGERGSTPMSSDPSDWGLTYFNLDAEIAHYSTLPAIPPPAKSRAMAVEFKNLRVTQGTWSPKSLTAHGALENVNGLYVQGFACFDVDSSERLVSPEQLSNVLETPVSVELLAIDSNRSRKIPLGRISGRQTISNSASTCGDRRNGHSFKYRIPVEQIVKISESGHSMFISARALLGSGKSIALQNPPTGPLKVPTVDLPNYMKGLTGHFDGVKGRTATGWACIPGKEDVLPIDILLKPISAVRGPGTFVANGYADTQSHPIKATWDACAQRGGHTFNIDLPPDFTLNAGQTLVAIVRPGNYASPSAARPWDVQLPQPDLRTNPIRVEPPLIKGYFETEANPSADTLRIRGWACIVGSERKLRIRIAGLMSTGSTEPLKMSTADRASEEGVQNECQIFSEAGIPEVRPDGKGFRFEVTLDQKDLVPFGTVSDIRVEADLGTGWQRPVSIPRVPGPTHR